MRQIGRRSFLMTPGWLTAGAAVFAPGANDRINLGVIGVRGRGRDHIAGFAAAPGTRVAAVCDIDQANVERAQALGEKLGGAKPRGCADMRRLFDSKDIDAVSIATCNHWHALAAIWACQAGKDVYVEKPACHNVAEGWRMVEAARKYQRIVQTGMQSRSTPHKIEAMRLLREGVIGRLYLAKGLCFKRRLSIGRAPDGPVPAGVDYDQWLGPAPVRPFNPNRFHYNWHWFWDYGNGDIGNQGVHEMDIARWGLNLDALPRKVTADGGKFIYDDEQETPNTLMASFDYGGMRIQFEVRGLISNSEASVRWDGQNTIGNIFYGSDGYLSIDSAGYQVYRGEKRELIQEGKAQPGKIWDTQPHFNNFIAAVRSRRRADLTADVAEGVLSAQLCHLANISYRTGRTLRWSAAQRNFAADSEANALLARRPRPPYAIPETV